MFILQSEYFRTRRFPIFSVWPKTGQNNDLRSQYNIPDENIDKLNSVLTVVFADPVWDGVIGPSLGGIPHKVHGQSQPGISGSQVLTLRSLVNTNNLDSLTHLRHCDVALYQVGRGLRLLVLVSVGTGHVTGLCPPTARHCWGQNNERHQHTGLLGTADFYFFEFVSFLKSVNLEKWTHHLRCDIRSCVRGSQSYT